MKKDIMKFDLIDVLHCCTGDVGSLFNILLDNGYDENPVVVDIMHTGKTLVLDMCRRIEAISGFVTEILGRIEIEREWSSLPCYRLRDNKIVGLKFTASKIFNEVLKTRESDGDLIVRISRPEPGLRHGTFSFLSKLKGIQETIQEGHLGPHGKLREIKETVKEINQFMDNEFGQIMDIKRDLEKTEDEIVMKLKASEQKDASSTANEAQAQDEDSFRPELKMNVA